MGLLHVIFVLPLSCFCYKKKSHSLCGEEWNNLRSIIFSAFVENAWGSTAVVFALVAEKEGAKDGELTGYILAHRTYSTWEGRTMCVKEIFVIPSARWSGVAMQLCRRLIQVCIYFWVQVKGKWYVLIILWWRGINVVILNIDQQHS